ncbi:MAG TPA: transcription antitermination factor NusB [Gammaproteobacteria bacterium]|nr:transcription antitermination factor NusB [Gammaproteobacteria bacterium]
MSFPQLDSFSKHARIRARRSAVQALYQWQMTQMPMADVILEFENERSELKKADKDYFRDLLHGTTGQSEKLDEYLAPLLDRHVKDLDPVERAILHIGVYELLFHPELPWRVVVNESVELAKMFGADQSHRYVNGVLDKAARNIRADEIKSVS